MCSKIKGMRFHNSHALTNERIGLEGDINVSGGLCISNRFKTVF